jgi:hypothetical protein
VLTGARQTGKTTVLDRLEKQAPDDKPVLRFNLDRMSLRSKLEEPGRDRLIEEVEGRLRSPITEFNGKALILIDEAQKLPSIFEQVKILHDEGGERFEIVITGSSALDIMDRSAESLAGRTHRIQVNAFTLEEAMNLIDGVSREYRVPEFIEKLVMGELTEEFLGDWESDRRYRRQRFVERLPDFLLTGLMPGVLCESDIAARFDLLSNYKDTYVDHDVRQLGSVADLGGFDRLIGLLASQAPGILVKQTLSKGTRLNGHTVDRYLSILQQTFIIDMLQPWRSNHGARLVKRPKIYFRDNGMMNLLLGISSTEMLKVSGKRGVLFETLVHSELTNYLVNRSLPTSLHFWRTHSGAEVDFVISAAGGLILVEAKSGSRAQKKLKPGLLDRSVRATHVVFGGEATSKMGNVRMTPAWYLS